MKKKNAPSGLSRNATLAISLLLLISFSMNVALVFLYRPTDFLVMGPLVMTQNKDVTQAAKELIRDIPLCENNIEAILKSKKTSDGRAILTRNEIDRIFNPLAFSRAMMPASTTWNTDPADQWIEFEDKGLGISLLVPYNKNWGNKDIALAPAEITDFIDRGSIDFGSLGYYTCAEGCGWTVQYSMTPQDPMDLQQAEDYYKKESGGTAKFERLKIGAHDVLKVEFTDAMGADNKHYMIFGDKYNLSLHSGWFGNQMDDATAKKIISSIELN